jgi:hypothetical protein
MAHLEGDYDDEKHMVIFPIDGIAEGIIEEDKSRLPFNRASVQGKI